MRKGGRVSRPRYGEVETGEVPAPSHVERALDFSWD